MISYTEPAAEIIKVTSSVKPEIIEPQTIIISIVIGFGLTLLIGFISWSISIAVRTFLHIIRSA